jgi:urease subunit gamma/beta
MLLTPTEMERLTIFTAAELARRRRGRGLKLNHPEAVAYLADELMEAARDGMALAEVMSLGTTILTTDDVLPGVARLIPLLTLEGQFPDGPKMISESRSRRRRAWPTPSSMPTIPRVPGKSWRKFPRRA